MILRELCRRKEVEVISAEACPDHIHMYVSILPKSSVSSFMGYLKGKSTLIIFESLALTEDTDSLFPIVPEEQWALNGKTISLWMITIIGLTKTKGKIIGEIEYYEAIKCLQPFIIATNGNWALVRAMTHDELDNLFKDLPRKLV